jgi:hypothetical protein
VTKLLKLMLAQVKIYSYDKVPYGTVYLIGLEDQRLDYILCRNVENASEFLQQQFDVSRGMRVANELQLIWLHPELVNVRPNPILELFDWLGATAPQAATAAASIPRAG